MAYMTTPSLSSELRVMTYNIRTASRWAVVDGKDGVHGRTWHDRRHAVAKSIEIGGAAVVATQEGLAWQLDELVGLLGPSWRWVGSGRYGDGGDEDEHAAVLYDSGTVALASSRDFWLSETPEHSSKSWGSALPRIATCALFRFGDLDFAVVSVHLDHVSELARSRSAALLRNINAPDVAFLAGDFNAPKSEQWYSDLTAHGTFLDAWTHADAVTCGSCGQSTYHAWRGSSEPSDQWVRPFGGDESRRIAISGTRHIDCVFVSAAALDRGRLAKARVITDDKRRRQYGGPFASDHYPVAVTYVPHQPRLVGTTSSDL